MTAGNGNGGIGGGSSRRPAWKKRSYRCYVVFLLRENGIAGPAENFAKVNFWDLAQTVGPDVFFIGLFPGAGLKKARQVFGVSNRTESAVVLLDVPLEKWEKRVDPCYRFSLKGLRTRQDAREFFDSLMEITHKTNFIGHAKRKATLDNVRRIASKAASLANTLSFLTPFIGTAQPPV